MNRLFSATMMACRLLPLSLSSAQEVTTQPGGSARKTPVKPVAGPLAH